MIINKERVQYSLFGFFVGIEANPANISKLFEALRGYDFVPSTIDVLQISVSDKTPAIIKRPQFINPSIGCTLSFYPDRIDFDFQNADSLNSGSTDIVALLCELLEKVDERINIPGHRLAHNEIIQVREAGEHEKVFLNIALATPFFDSLPCFEARLHRLTRVSINTPEKPDEVINVNFDVEVGSKTDPETQESDRIYKLIFDINSLAENTEIRFTKGNWLAYYTEITKIQKQILHSFGID